MPAAEPRPQRRHKANPRVEESLDRSVFAERAMEDWEDNVDIDRSIGGAT